MTSDRESSQILIERAATAVPRLERSIARWRIQRSLNNPSRQWRNWIRRDGIESFGWIIIANVWLILAIVVSQSVIWINAFVGVSRALYASLLVLAGVCFVLSVIHFGQALKVRRAFRDREPTSSYEDVRHWLASLPPELRSF